MATYPYLTQVVHSAARARPDQPCLIYGERRTSNAQFRDRVARLAGGLLAAGVQPGDRVAIIAQNSDRFVEAFFGCFWAGAVASPVNIRWNSAEMAYALSDCGASTLLVDDTCLAAADALRQNVPGLRTLVHIGDGPAPDGMKGYEELIAAGPEVPDAGRAGDDLAFVLYTGGTTGSPKGVMLSHANLAAATVGMLAAGCGTGEVYLHAPPLFHIAGVQVMAGHFLGGHGPHVIIPAFSPAAILGAIQEHQVTDVMLVPTMLQLVLADPGFASYDLSSLQRIFYGAAPMTEPLLRAAMRALPGAGFVQGYGMTETALTIMLPPWYYTVEGQKEGKISSIGTALPLAEVAIRDPAGREVPPGTVGELTVRSPSVMLGYYGNPDLTAATIRDGWLYSGDGAYMDADGFVHLVDRLKDMIITGGENVYSTEVETALASHPAVAMCAVIGVPDPTWGERVHATVVLRPGDAASAGELMEHCRERIAGYKCPRSIDFTSALPVSAAGKVLKARLRAEYAGRPGPAGRSAEGTGQRGQ
jgi:acyl-CoA synthetase (AMP-forming)/AMP-acid ligase II